MVKASVDASNPSIDNQVQKLVAGNKSSAEVVTCFLWFHAGLAKLKVMVVDPRLLDAWKRVDLPESEKTLIEKERLANAA